MPVRVACQCGQNLNVPDHLAGKVVKCPKCQKGVRVPGGAQGSGTAAKESKAMGAKPAGSKGGEAPPRADALAGLFDQAGLTKREGTFCPSCDKPLPPGTAICVNCGFHLEQGAKIAGFEVETTEFGNRRLVEAAEMMKREAETEKRLLGAGMPWWMILGVLAGMLVMMSAVAIRMDLSTSGKESTIPLFRRIQNSTFLAVMAGSFGFANLLIAVFAYIAIVVTAFKEKTKEGLLATFAPLYIVYYMFTRIFAKKIVSTVIIFWVTAILAAVSLAYSLPKI